MSLFLELLDLITIAFADYLVSRSGDINFLSELLHAGSIHFLFKVERIRHDRSSFIIIENMVSYWLLLAHLYVSNYENQIVISLLIKFNFLMTQSIS